MNNLVPFQFENHNIRVITDKNGDPLFVAKDVAEVLGYKDTVNAVKQHCRGVVQHHPIVDALGRTQKVRIINESDLYRLIFGSELPEAKRFGAWVFDEVIPSIRKTGSYEAPITSAWRNVMIDSTKPFINRCIHDQEAVLSEMRATFAKLTQESDADLIRKLSRYQERELEFGPALPPK